MNEEPTPLANADQAGNAIAELIAAMQVTAPRWGDMPPPERIAELEARLAEWARLPEAERGDPVKKEGRSAFDPYGPHQWEGGLLSGADVFFLAARALAGSAELEGIAAAAARLRTTDVSERFSLDLSALRLAGAVLYDAQLTGATLCGAHLEGVVLADAHLEGVVLYDAHLEGADLRGAQLEGAVLYDAHLERATLLGAQLDGAVLRDAQLTGADLGEAHLERADLSRAQLTGADLSRAQLTGADLYGAQLDGADLRGASFDKASRLNEAVLTGARFDQVVFDNANLAVLDWGPVTILGDERTARELKNRDGKPRSREQRVDDYKAAVRANRVLAVALQDQGLSEDAARFTYRAKFLQRRVLRLQRRYLSYLGSCFLDLVSGYGYRPLRSFATYVFVVSAFAGLYALLAYLGLTAEPFGSWDSPFVLSVTSFHGRVFFAGGLQLTDWAARVGAIEAVFGLLIEIIFIATFTQRFFTDR
jgi:uncharacterized protein YjbI with pentapeptide repeats